MAQKLLRKVRKDKGLNQVQLAAKSGVDQRVISKIERGLVSDVMNSTAAALEKALGVPRGSILFGRTAA